ncbi:MAG: DEAD/DEAH box helicase, partial [Planctomycetaceae bacterium]
KRIGLENVKHAESLKSRLGVLSTQIQIHSTLIRKLEAALIGLDRAGVINTASGARIQLRSINERLAEIKKSLEEISVAVLRNAKIVGATVTRTFLRPSEFADFDTVIVDEASMILLPAVFQIAGLAKESVIIAGDFQQLPPIVQTNEKAIHDILAHDVFRNAGISLETVDNPKFSNLVMLDEQFRMDDSICAIISKVFYKNELTSHPDRKKYAGNFIEPFLNNRLTIIDTSSIWPFTTRDPFNSHCNLMHALAIRNLIHELAKENRHLQPNGQARIGVCAPYAAQAKLMSAVLKANGFDKTSIRTSTVHGFQGDEREIIILDLVDSVGERNAGILLQANELGDSGAKLFNVA